VPSVAANGLTFDYESFGDDGAEPCLLVSGLGVQMIRWAVPFCRALAAEGYRVIRFDNRYNRTPSSAEAFIERSDPPLRTVSTPSLPAPAAPSKPPATRKRPPKQAAGSAAPELPLGPVATAGDGDKGDGKAPIDPAGGIGGHDPDAPIARLEIIATPWTHSLRQHGRPGGRRSPANPA